LNKGGKGFTEKKGFVKDLNKNMETVFRVLGYGDLGAGKKQGQKGPRKAIKRSM